MNDRPHEPDRTIDEILKACEAEGGGPSESSDRMEADEVRRRLDTEALGLLAYGVEPEQPRPEVRSRVLAAVAAEAEGATVRTPAPAPAESGTPLPFERPSERGSVSEPSTGDPGRRGGGWGRWASLAAAVLALAALGLAAVLWVELDQSRQTLARLVQEQQELTDRLAQQAQVQQALVLEADRLSRVMRVASTPGVEICPMRPVGERPIAPRAFAVLYMPPGQEDWYLVISDLDPAETGMYKVWLNTPEGPIQVAVIDDGDRTDGRVAVRIPPGVIEEVRMLSALVTLEQERGGTSPSGSMVLFGDEKMQVL